jgi:hypothetical protein
MATHTSTHDDPDAPLCQDDDAWLTDTGRSPLAGSTTCDVCHQEPALYNVDFTTATGYDGKLACPTCTDRLKEQHPYGIVVPLLTRAPVLPDACAAPETPTDKLLSVCNACGHISQAPSDEYEGMYETSVCLPCGGWTRNVHMIDRTTLLREKLEHWSSVVSQDHQCTEDTLAHLRLVAPASLAVEALETVLEALEDRLSHLHTRLAFLNACPRAGYYELQAHQVLAIREGDTAC